MCVVVDIPQCCGYDVDMQNISRNAMVIQPLPTAYNFLDLTGQKYGLFTVVGFAGVRGKHRMWWCDCSCGSLAYVSSCNLRTGHSTSCGCHCVKRIKETHTRHGMSDTRTHRSWMSMHDRCRNEGNSAFKNYGGRGITVCHRWGEFKTFLADMGQCPEDHTIDRQDNEKGYYPENCRWATHKEQSRNRRASRFLSIDGERINTAEAAERFGIKYKTLMKRLYDGWSDVEAIRRRPE